MADTASKTLHFYRLSVHHRAAEISQDVISWDSRLQDHFRKTLNDRAVALAGGGQLVTEPVPSNRWQVIVGRVLVGDTGLRAGSWNQEAFRSVAPESVEEFFARTTYVQFIEGTNAFAMVGGPGDHPAGSSVAALARAICPLEEEHEWKAQPIVSEAEIERFQKIRGIKQVRFSTDVFPGDLFSSDDAARPDLGQWATEVATRLNAEIRMEARITIKSQGSSSTAFRELRRMLADGLARLSPAARKIEAVPDTEADGDLVELARHKLAATIDLPVAPIGLTGEELKCLVLSQMDQQVRRWKDRIVEQLS